MEFEQVKAYLEANRDSAEVQTLLTGIVKITLDDVKRLAAQDEGVSKWIQSEKDSHFSKGLATWKEKTMPELIDQEIKKRYPEKTPEQLELDTLRREIEQMRRDKERESLRLVAKDYALEKKLPANLVDFFVGENEEGTKSNLESFEKAWSEAVKGAVGETFKQHSREPHKSSSTKQSNNPFSKETFNLTEQGRLLKENPELAKQLMAQASN